MPKTAGFASNLSQPVEVWCLSQDNTSMAWKKMYRWRNTRPAYERMNYVADDWSHSTSFGPGIECSTAKFISRHSVALDPLQIIISLKPWRDCCIHIRTVII
ncbi:hypothetical protein ABW21_db0207820 [Orbilia brochopaga]|nr:hypothetical protein ABW21_db0207820 [Drechslerella brochopaga]